MKIDHTTLKQNNISPLTTARQIDLCSRREREVSFTNAGVAGAAILRALEVSPAWGAVATDIASMTGPRTAIDFIERGPNMGMETGRQQGSSTLNHAFIGFYGAGAGLLLSGALNKAYNVKANKVFASTNVLNEFKRVFDDTKDADKTFKQILGSIETITTDGSKKKLSDFDGLVEKVFKAYQNAGTDKKAVKEAKQLARYFILKATGSESNYKLAEKSKLSLDTFIDSLFSITDTLKSPEVKKDSAKFFKSLKNFGLERSALGLGIASAIGLGMQPLNTYITKRKTGSDGFAGVGGRKKDRSDGFKMLKTGISAAGLVGVIASIGGGLKNLPTTLQFKGMTPTIEQFKLIYGLTIVSRFMSARDKDELREAVVRDTIGFLSWLVLGNFVTKGVIHAKDKSLIKESWNGKSFFKSTIMTRDEVLHKALSKIPGVETVKDGKAVPFKELLKELKRLAPASKEVKQLKLLNIAQLAGYAYSCIVLGVALPKLNIYMTRKSEEKRQAKLAEQGNYTGLPSPHISDIIK